MEVEHPKRFRVPRIVWIGVALLALIVLNAAIAAVIANVVVAQKNVKETNPLPSKQMMADLAAFEKSPNATTWANLHADIIAGQLSPYVDSRIVSVLASNDLSKQLVNAAAVDLSAYDVGNSIKWLHQINIAGRSDPAGNGGRVVRRTGQLAWLLLALRSSYDNGGIDLTRTDLRDGADFVGQGMNLSNVDFSGAQLPSGSWRSSNLSGATFVGVRTPGRLTCAGCNFGSIQITGTLVLSDGRWTSP